MRETEAAVAIILAPGAGGQELLLIHRAERPDDPWSGHMALPGGRREPPDKSLLATAVRETFEETGVRLRPGSLVCVLEDLQPRNRSIPKVVVRPHVFSLKSRPSLRPGEEVAECLWVSVERLKSSACRIHVPERKALVDAYLIGPHIVWGITRRILTAFLRAPTGPRSPASRPRPARRIPAAGCRSARIRG
ncbi:MAG: CoA pyrophosphatase [Elusimicrobia bacterium]|nr:CoA pyrophosphatase [Elusimicrobiota bacterium]